jgi:hypothetical protein
MDGPAMDGPAMDGPAMDGRAEVRRFAEQLMRQVRDEAIAECDVLATGEMLGEGGAHWREVLAGDDVQRAVQELIPAIVDKTLFYLLHALDHNELPLAWRRPDGSYLSLYEAGRREMAGWLVGPDSWRHHYSSQRITGPDADPG